MLVNNSSPVLMAISLFAELQIDANELFALLNSQGVVAVAMMLLSSVLEFFPGLSTRFQALSSQMKRLTFAVLLVLVSVVTVGFGCYSGSPDFAPYCTNASIVDIVFVVIQHLIYGGAATLINHNYVNKAFSSKETDTSDPVDGTVEVQQVARSVLYQKDSEPKKPADGEGV